LGAQQAIGLIYLGAMGREMERIRASELARDEAVAERTVELDGITAFLDSRIPDAWDSNYLRVGRPGIDAAAILAAGDETQDGHD
jgi:hypothetical protein